MSANSNGFEKHAYEKAVKISISMPMLMRDKAVDRVRRRGFTKFSDYIQDLIRQDTMQPAAN